ncbi:HAMP domain-containing histidine kinase [Acaricomes phytoseiuli]|uniref:sensor histidine kinase n=1 Tax=Acaricomes phytoseiuli TaxID=291968 RepID=UPI00222340AB|nr:HAMP domain-containing sensor histidine kinase [Acaricomes phytoseiuli]MCW1249910.1 HAMP domain-containing histidine kinase [Acaricomes phytoseiuli]
MVSSEPSSAVPPMPAEPPGSAGSGSASAQGDSGDSRTHDGSAQDGTAQKSTAAQPRKRKTWTDRIPLRAKKIRHGAHEAMRLSRWSLRSKLVLSTMGLLTGICFVVGLVSYLSMNIVLNEQANSSLRDASNKVTTVYNLAYQNQIGLKQLPPIQGILNGTLSAAVHDGALVENIINLPAKEQGKSEPLTNVQVTSSDVATITSVTPSRSIDVSLSFGDYRLIGVRNAYNDIIVTGIPLKGMHDTLSTLLATVIFVSAAGLLAMGLVATALIRRAMAPLDQLASVATRVAKLQLNEGEVKLAERAPPNASNPHTEVGTVGMALNKMLDNVASALQSRQRSETKVRQFVADASHELRTPLTAIRGYTEMIRMTEELSPSGEKSLGRVESQSKRMGAMVENLLTLARLDEGRPLELKETELTQLVLETVHDMKVAITDHQWQLDLPSDPFVIRADVGALRQVLLNLLSNAAKHTDSGTTVTTSLRALPNGIVQLRVLDDGPGIPEEFQAQIFDRFARADVARSGHDGTTGLGLSIVQAIVHAHGGQISLTSRPGHTAFMVDLPAGRDAAGTQSTPGGDD